MQDSIAHVPVEGAFGTDVDSGSEQFLKVLHKRDMVEEASSRFPVDKKIEIAPLLILAARYRPEDPRVADGVAGDDLADLIRLGGEDF